jgi:addiction module HigA family antidote
MADCIAPVIPGELLKEELLVPLGNAQYCFAKEIGVPARRIGQIALGRRPIAARTDLRLCRYLGLFDGCWSRAQAACDTKVARRKIGPELDRIVQRQAASDGTSGGERE